MCFGATDVRLRTCLIGSKLDHGVGARATAAQAAWQEPNAELHATTVVGAVAPAVAPHVAPTSTVSCVDWTLSSH